LYWTRHSRDKMGYYRLSESRVKSVINYPDRVEEGIAPKTIAIMKAVTGVKHPYEVWVMVQEVKARRKIISAWRYPGQTSPGDPLPPEILAELENVLE